MTPVELLRDGFVVAALAALPLVAATVFAGVVAGIAAHRFGLSEAGISVAVRAVAVAVALLLWGHALGDQILVFTRSAWVDHGPFAGRGAP